MLASSIHPITVLSERDIHSIDCLTSEYHRQSPKSLIKLLMSDSSATITKDVFYINRYFVRVKCERYAVETYNPIDGL